MAGTTFLLLSVLGIGLASFLSNPSESCTCGKTKNEIQDGFEVVRGQDADLNEYPWMVIIQPNGCGGTLINSKWILTAKHCIDKTLDGPTFDVRSVTLGAWDLKNVVDGETTKDFDVVEVVLHDECAVDLALLRVQGDIDISTYTPVCLPKKDLDVRGERVTITGWGDLCGNGSGFSPDECDALNRHKDTRILQEADMPVPSNEECGPIEGGPMFENCTNDNPDKICFGGEEGKSACHGDSGGPVIYDDNGKWTLVSAVSGPNMFTDENDCSGSPGHYTQGPELAKFMDWIEETAVGGISCAN